MHTSVDSNLKEGLNVLIGPNGSGKTCLLTSLKFLRDLFLFGAAQAMGKNGGAKRIIEEVRRPSHFFISHDYGVDCTAGENCGVNSIGRYEYLKLVEVELLMLNMQGSICS